MLKEAISCIQRVNIEVMNPVQDIKVDEEFYQKQNAYRIQTPAATYYYHQLGGGLAALIDPDGADWIGYRTNGGSDGRFRGLPNIKYPEGYLHPGSRNAYSTLNSTDPSCCRITTHSLDGLCEAEWVFNLGCAVLTLLKVPIPYWFLYEGTPGGIFDGQKGYIVRSNGVCSQASEIWNAVLEPGWLYFGSQGSSWVLFLAQCELEPKLSSYWPMEGNMTVFGFGRKGLKHYLEKVPARYLVGFLKAGTYDVLSAQINGLIQQYNLPKNEGGFEWRNKEK